MLTKIFSLANHCLRDWLLQRVTATIMAIYSLIWVAILILLPIKNYSSWKSLFENHIFRYLTLLFLFSMVYHAWLGVRDISMDYIPSVKIRKIFQILLVFFLVLYVVWGFIIFWSA